jgi:deoxyribose-phosphate aldolase
MRKRKSLDPSSIQIAAYIDHTLLKADATAAEITRLCSEAIKYHFTAVCVNPFFVPLAAGLLEDSSVKVCTVVDFPLGAGTREMKVCCAERSVKDGAHELDMVMNIATMKSRDHAGVEADIRAVVQAVPGDILVKVILEVCYLKDDEIRTACGLALDGGADYVKTSTGFGPHGATIDAVKIMKEAVGDRMGIKAAGGIRDIDTALAFVRCGATRIGTSSGVEIVTSR